MDFKIFGVKYIVLYLALSVSLCSFSQIPSGYYDSAENLTGSELREALHLIVKNHTTFPYTSTSTDVWDLLKEADKDHYNPDNVIGIYSGFSMNAADEYAGGLGWSREHIWPQSRGEFGTTQGAGTDIHHMRAEDISTNSARNNRFFDIAPNQYNDATGNYNGLTESYTSPYMWVWEPRDEVKGDIARMIFYMVVRYEGTDGDPNLDLTDEILPSDDKSPLMGKASRLIEWHYADPVSDEERLRNDIIFSYQGNRNPFIDHPGLVCKVFTEYCNQPVQSGELFISEYIEGTSWNKAIEIVNPTSQTIDLSYYFLKKQNNGEGSWGSDFPLTGHLVSGEVFSIAHSSADGQLTMAADVLTASGIMTFNGDDPIALFNNRNLVDMVGYFDAGPVSFATDVTLVRKSHITEPNSSFTPSEWTVYPVNTFDYFGFHNTIPSSVDEFGYTEVDITIDVDVYNKSIQISHTAESVLNYALYDINGRTLESGRFSASPYHIQLSPALKGVYFLQLSTNTAISTRKILFP